MFETSSVVHEIITDSFVIDVFATAEITGSVESGVASVVKLNGPDVEQLLNTLHDVTL